MNIDLCKTIQQTPGAISMTEIVGLYNTIRGSLKTESAFDVDAVDFGSHCGKSSLAGMVAIESMGYTSEVFCLVDPLYDLENKEAWAQTVQGSVENNPWPIHDSDALVFDISAKIRKHLQWLPPSSFNGCTSIQFLTERFPDMKFSYVFIDSDDHQQELVMKEAELIKDRVVPGGLVFFHDYMNQYIGPAMAHGYLVGKCGFEKIDIDWKQAEAFTREHDLEKDNDSWHMPGVEYPKHLGCVRKL